MLFAKDAKFIMKNFNNNTKKKVKKLFNFSCFDQIFQKIALETKNLSRFFFRIDLNVDHENFVRRNDDNDVSNECNENVHANRC